MAEIGLMHDAGCVYVCDGDNPIVDSKVMRRLLAYAHGLGVLVAHRPADPWLSDGAAATESEFAGRMGLPSVPAVAEKIMLERDLALVELTGARLLADQLSTACALESLARAKARGLPVTASASINHLTFNELDIGDYRTFWKLVPPLRSEDDRQALIAAVVSGLVDIVVSAHAPAPAEDKRLPFEEAAPGSIGLETLLPALISLHHDAGAPLIRLIRDRHPTLAKAHRPSGRLGSPGAARPTWCSATSTALRVIDAAQLTSKSKNSAFDGRRLQGVVRMTLVDGRVVYEAAPPLHPSSKSTTNQVYGVCLHAARMTRARALGGPPFAARRSARRSAGRRPGRRQSLYAYSPPAVAAGVVACLGGAARAAGCEPATRLPRFSKPISTPYAICAA